MNVVRSTLNPASYHGHGRRPPFFEGWYFKLVDASEEHRYAVIPGIFVSEDPEHHHAFVQILDGRSGQTAYHRYPAGEFWAAEGSFEVRIGPNRFSEYRMSLELPREGLSARGELWFDSPNPWPVTWRSPGIMGWYAWVPFMECYHGVVSLDHRIEGRLEVDGQEIDFADGRGYIEKDWGRSFPAAWVWYQTNHFGQPGISLTASVAIIPWVRSSFPGFIIGLWRDGRLYRWATYTGARIERLEIRTDRVVWIVRDKRYRLEMEAVRSEGGLLQAPTVVDMGRRIAETLNTTVDVRLFERQAGKWQLLWSDTGRHGGLEAAGDLARLQSMWAERGRDE